jgi:hypothetical protein
MNSFPPPYSRGDNTFAIIGSVRFATSLPAKKWFGLARHQAPIVFPAIPEAARLYDVALTEINGSFACCAVGSQFLDERDGEKVFAVYLDSLRQALKRHTLVKDCSTDLAQWEIEVLVPDSAALEGTRSIQNTSCRIEASGSCRCA